MAVFPLNPSIGDKYTASNREHTYDGKGWYYSGGRKLAELNDLSIKSPVNGDMFLSANGGFTGTDQSITITDKPSFYGSKIYGRYPYLYPSIIQTSTAPEAVWNNSVSDVNPFDVSLLSTGLNMVTAIELPWGTAGLPTIDGRFNQWGAPGGVGFVAFGSYNGIDIATGKEYTDGIVIKIPKGFNTCG